mmetsp:Transcript_15663/g.21843  ORF Transcript_15663/g.21843 Transcript_15663/m.21843 type:complete len:694 (+) Transcript_15663:182-2263(+)|eukprot:CAMPEP_0168565972 /NCGR_PEP_ID=MMETSP0413-20121227/14155_1 /TAXON_ID=136452 /ORGANISM="Filamoeba nolandi, Strain NC-AS-23-1" /LENGTH=693 /DNA_ID=CAMNT_0008597929 /DNA_START=153 /DNA_END=2234 /DNA_ORIENTATION=+
MSTLNPSQVIKGRWRLTKKIGQGAFGEIYQARNVITGEDVAIKLERVDTKKQVLKLEVAVLKKLQDCPYVCRFITCGRFSDYNYMVMELLGENLSELRRRQQDGKFSLATTLKLAIQMLKATEAVHQLGYLHRDIKPSNFAIGLGTKKRNVFIIDFGLARRFLTPGSQNDIRPARETTGFRGTARYASINSHLSRDLGRRDDLWSLFYVLIEFAKGSLPWRKLKDKDEIGEMKIQYNNLELLKDLPSEFLSFMQHLQGLQYGDKPDYQYLLSLLRDLYYKIGANERTPYDWEVSPGTTPIPTANSATSANAPTAVTSNNPNVNPSSLSNGSTSPPIGSVKPDSMISLGGVSLASTNASVSPIFTPHGSRTQIHHVNSSTSIGTQELDDRKLGKRVASTTSVSSNASKKVTNSKVGIPDLSGRQYVSSNLDVLASEGNALNSSGSSQKHKRSGSVPEQDLSSGANNNDNNSVANVHHHSTVSDNKSRVTSDEDNKDKGISPQVAPRKQKQSTRSDTRSHNSASYNEDIEELNNAIYSDEAENINNSTASGNKNRKASNTNTVEKDGEKEDDDTRTQEYKEDKPKKRKKKTNTQDGENGVQPKTRSKSRSKLIDSDKEAKKTKKKKKKKKGSSKDPAKSKPKSGTHQQFESMEVEQTDPKEKTNENPTAATQNTQTDHLPSRKDPNKKCVGCTIV